MSNLNQTMLKGAKAYQGQKVDDRNSSVANYATLVKRVAIHLKARLPPQVELDDLIQSGMIGLMDALQNFKDGQGATFETYAAIRIRGAMIDELRQSDWTPRSVHQNSRAIRESMSRLAHELGRPATDQEIAADLKVDINRYHQMLLDSNTSQVMGIEDTGLTDDVIGEHPLSEIVGHEPDDKLYDSIYNEQFRGDLAKAIASLPERERLIVSFYYDEELNLREIGLIMGISESRACQVLSQAIIRLRGMLDHWASSSKNEKRIAKPRHELYADGALTKAQLAAMTQEKDLALANNQFHTKANNNAQVEQNVEIAQNDICKNSTTSSKSLKEKDALTNVGASEELTSNTTKSYANKNNSLFSFDSNIPISQRLQQEVALSSGDSKHLEKMEAIQTKFKASMLKKTLSNLESCSDTSANASESRNTSPKVRKSTRSKKANAQECKLTEVEQTSGQETIKLKASRKAPKRNNEDIPKEQVLDLA